MNLYAEKTCFVSFWKSEFVNDGNFVILVDEKLNWHPVDPTSVMGFLALLSCVI